VIDWPNVTRGNPDADVGRTLLMMRMGTLPPGTPLVVRVGARVARSVLRAAYLRAYRRARDVDLPVLLRWEKLRAADRLADNIPGERATLLAILDAAMAAGAQPEG
jgi:aminoglycoside phosphotransferase (APT) family kinase protein